MKNFFIGIGGELKMRLTLERNDILKVIAYYIEKEFPNNDYDIESVNISDGLNREIRLDHSVISPKIEIELKKNYRQMLDGISNK